MERSRQAAASECRTGRCGRGPDVEFPWVVAATPRRPPRRPKRVPLLLGRRPVQKRHRRSLATRCGRTRLLARTHTHTCTVSVRMHTTRNHRPGKCRDETASSRKASAAHGESGRGASSRSPRPRESRLPTCGSWKQAIGSRRAVLGRNGRSRHGDLLEREFPAVLSARQLVRQPSPAMPITLTIKTTGGQQAQVGEYAPSQCIARGRERRESPAVRGPGRVVPRCLKPCLCRCRRRTRIRWWTSRTRLNARLSSVASSEGFPHIQHSMRGPVPMNAPGRR